VREERNYYVYILASGQHGTLYVGVTNSLLRRVAEHKEKKASSFTRRYEVDRLVWWTSFRDISDAIAFEKKLKRWRRDWKVNLIEADNPRWSDLYPLMLKP